ncbi:hypothetical protein SAMD00019534_090440 [Acytostelium subglobosum LB1]|uniref:hypothetical protein n=1 Tax=Acytostelium subglobosum LB1 TaxID=1410327 RepID=UPI000644F7A8|nr:hypothetical protein SAMD00019534_090440 [Acytostelium subglobosum LB1]GAM25869.1 hypothetical protein SAMD00019534_090440 [Acytostelium subglobosum LB1]|eukprot:XP_012751387.1 hypothetical protein SAMD00019534_090440 [Acytostelium subglobosum LB1]
MVKEIVITANGSYDVLKVRERPDPALEPNTVKIAVKACGLNFSELMARQGLYPGAPPLPCVVGYEVAGVVTEVNADETEFKVGQRVAAMTKFGGHASVVVANREMVFLIPDFLSFAEAASIPVNYLTAYHMLFHVARVRPGDQVLVHMAAGGVGVAAIQLLKTVENVTVFGTASASKHDFIRNLGCTHPIDYNTKDYKTEITEILKDKPQGKRGLDIILDPLGDFKTSYDMLNPCGHLVIFGAANMVNGSTRSIFNILKQYWKIPSFSSMSLMDQNKTVSGVHLGHMFMPVLVQMLRQEMLDIIELYNQGKLKSIVSKEFTFEQAGEAHKYMEQRKNIGKVILVPTEEDLTKEAPAQ